MFTLVVEDVFCLNNQLGVLATGMVHGRVAVGDTVYICDPMHGNSRTTVARVDVKKDGKVGMAFNEPVSLQLADIKKEDDLTIFSVLSDEPMILPTKENPVVNNMCMAGLARDYKRLVEDTAYRETFHRMLVRTPYYVGFDQTEKGLFFPKITNPNYPDTKFQGIFTSAEEIKKWDQSIPGTAPKKIQAISFQKAYELADRSGADMVLNPFSDGAVYLKGPQLDKIGSLFKNSY